MTRNPTIGFVGVGLMGHGMAKNIVEKGFPLRVIAYRKREAVDDLVGRGAVEVGSLAEMADQCDAVVLCVTGAPEVAATVEALLLTARPGFAIIDATTSEPDLSERLAADLAARDMTFLDAPMSRTPAHAWSGELTTYCGGPPELIEAWRPLISTWASTIIPTGGPVGSAHALKLINNLVGLGYAAIWAECYAMVAKVGADPAVFRAIVSGSGLNCGNFQAFSDYAVNRDASAHRFTIANGFKDLGYYQRLANSHRAATFMSDAAHQTLKLAMAMGMAGRYVPEVGDALLALNDPPPLPRPAPGPDLSDAI
ncbi:NAD(P)-dependent oxidoreductase [Amaricoccus sp.]|uniref:NAD(P)-dependent oxidoreductase n=1 Tax=Amaricoccus sp. TaxID=1872485 RepID=UPI001B592EE4|nr:NAD(P)-dependent oxidoreductase [Amaricoccus sp.]MBP7003593.1 NAD(P)-dependent oxidoreductase [Amaricoccus sp.]